MKILTLGYVTSMKAHGGGISVQIAGTNSGTFDWFFQTRTADDPDHPKLRERVRLTLEWDEKDL